MEEIILRKVLLIAIVFLSSFCPEGIKGQENDFPNLSDGWHKSEFIGLLNGADAYNLYYRKDYKKADNSIVIQVILVYTSYGIKHYDDLGISSNTIAMEYKIGVDVNRDRCWITDYTKHFKNGSYSGHNESPGLIYPDPGTLEAYYISLGKNLIRENK